MPLPTILTIDNVVLDANNSIEGNEATFSFAPRNNITITQDGGVDKIEIKSENTIIPTDGITCHLNDPAVAGKVGRVEWRKGRSPQGSCNADHPDGTPPGTCIYAQDIEQLYRDPSNKADHIDDLLMCCSSDRCPCPIITHKESELADICLSRPGYTSPEPSSPKKYHDSDDNDFYEKCCISTSPTPSPTPTPTPTPACTPTDIWSSDFWFNRLFDSLIILIVIFIWASLWPSVHFKSPWAEVKLGVLFALLDVAVYVVWFLLTNCKKDEPWVIRDALTGVLQDLMKIPGLGDDDDRQTVSQIIAWLILALALAFILWKKNSKHKGQRSTDPDWGATYDGLRGRGSIGSDSIGRGRALSIR